MSYEHLSITEREKIAIYRAQGLSRCQIANRLKLENYPIQISYRTIYRAIYAGIKGYVSNRGKIPISHELAERPLVATERSRFGDLEADTIVGFKSRLLICKKLARLGSKEVETALLEALQGQPLRSVTSDRGREFQLHGNVTKVLGVEFYFPPPHQPWQRGTNENTNGLLREYFPKGYDFKRLSEADLQAVVDQLNHRPRKSLGYKTPAELYFSTPLHLV